MYSPCTLQINQHLQWPLHIGSSPNRILPFLKGVTSIVETPQTWIWGATFFLNILYMLNKIYIHYITTLFVLESFIISCWLLKGKQIGIGIGQFAKKKSVSESATKNHDRCITKNYAFSNLTSWWAAKLTSWLIDREGKPAFFSQFWVHRIPIGCVQWFWCSGGLVIQESKIINQNTGAFTKIW